ncbi:MarR family winged helix-turn-helix transcriptional regulator [Nioella aestuarii]|uniref:MarR family winged helix-turn-helix transcriptional regulator n=1 Tax=Nioella aestuarii TaxID=1662864 RepID=UPI003D7F1CB7
MSKPNPVPPVVTRVSDETLRGFVGYHMKRAFNVVQADLAATLKPFDLRMVTYSALVLIVDNPGLRQSQLAAAMDIERPNLVVIIDELEGRDLILREKVPTDRRAYALVPTLAGRQLCARAIEAVKSHEARLLQGVGMTEYAQALDVLRQIEAKGLKE